jgi:ClpP class serine protease
MVPVDLAGSQALEQQLVDQIGQSQSAVLAALRRRNAAVTAYANATGSATLKVSRRVVGAPATHAKTGASGGGASEREFEND